MDLCDRYPFSLLVKSVSAVSGQDIMAVKLLHIFVCAFDIYIYFLCGFDFLLLLLFGCLYVVAFVFGLA